MVRLTTSGVATCGYVPTLPRPGWVVRLAQIQRVFWRSRVGVADSAWAWRYTLYEHITKMRLSTADCICLSGFWGRSPQTVTGALPLNPARGLPSPRPLVPTLPPNPGYATAKDQSNCCWNMEIYRFFNMADLRYVGFVGRVAYLDLPHRVLGGLYHNAKFGWNRCSSFNILRVWLENAPNLHAPLRLFASFEPSSSKIRRRASL